MQIDRKATAERCAVTRSVSIATGIDKQMFMAGNVSRQRSELSAAVDVGINNERIWIRGAFLLFDPCTGNAGDELTYELLCVSAGFPGQH